MKERIKRLVTRNKKKQGAKPTERELITCRNCETEFKGNFCPECGQSVNEWNKPFSILIYDFMGTVLSFDTRFFNTLGTILFKPGRFSSDFMNGKRKKYMPPFQFYVFISFIFFLLLNVHTSRLINDNINNEDLAINDTTSDQTLSITDKGTFKIEIDSLVLTNESEELGEAIQDLDSIVRDHTDPDEEDDGVTVTFSKSDLSKLQDELKKDMKKEKRSETEKRILNNLIKMLDYPDVFMSKMFRFLSWSLFILMPLFGFWLYVFFRKSRKYYSGHFIYSLLVHATTFLFLSIIMIVKLIFPEKAASPENYLFWFVPLYVWIGMKKFYGRSIVRTFFKMIFVSMIYGLSVFITIVAVLVFSLYF